jgi:hypothetical protein
VAAEPAPAARGGQPKVNRPASTKTSACDVNAICGKPPAFSPVIHEGATFVVCEPPVRNFDSGLPDVHPRYTPAMALKGVPITEVEMSVSSKAAWEFAGAMAACLPDDVPDSDWEYGFVQTVESLTFDADYLLGWSAHKGVSARSRDANPGADAPWYDPPGAVAQPQGFSAQAGGLQAARLVDSPSVRFLARRGGPGDPVGTDAPPPPRGSVPIPCALLNSIEINGEFTIWMVARRKGSQALAFLLNTALSISRRGERKAAQDPEELTAWDGKAGKGQHALGAIGPGKGSKDPVFASPIAMDALAGKPQVTAGKACPVVPAEWKSGKPGEAPQGG